MATVLEREDSETAQLEERALERMISALCKQLELLRREIFEGGVPSSREAHFQLAAFDERRARAVEALQARSSEPRTMRIERLQKLVDALECSKEYFRRLAETA